MKIRLEDGQIAYIVGGNQMNTNMESNKPYVSTLAWGTQVPDQTPQVIASGLSYSSAYGWGNSNIGLFTSSTPGTYSNILGGIQQNSNLNSSAAWVQTLNWGLGTGTPMTIASAQSYSTNYNWGNSQINFFSTADGPWLTIVGGYQQCNNLTSSAGWVTVSEWGVQSGPSALIAEFQAYSTTYQWGNSRVFLYFEEG
jgi:hypothetical protein